MSGLLGPLAGRLLIDRHGGRDVLAATNLVFAPGLVLLASPTGRVTIVAAWLVTHRDGVRPLRGCFRDGAGLYGRGARNAITGITLFAGFASTVGWPLSAFFIGTFGWRGACLAWAVLHLVIGCRLTVSCARRRRRTPETEHTAVAPSGVPWTMIVLAGVFGACWCVSTAMAAHLPRLLAGDGSWRHGGSCGSVAGRAGEVAARLVEFGCSAGCRRLFRRDLQPDCIRLARRCWRSSGRLQRFHSSCCMAPATAC